MAVILMPLEPVPVQTPIDYDTIDTILFYVSTRSTRRAQDSKAL